MIKKHAFVFERATKIGILQFVLVLTAILLSNIFNIATSDKYQLLLLGSSFFIVFTFVSYDQTKIFGLKFRLTGLISSIIGLLLVYSPILLYTLDIIDFPLWISLIWLGVFILTISVISDYYVIGIPEIVRAINYLIEFIIRIPKLIKKFFLFSMRNIFFLIPFIIILLISRKNIVYEELIFIIFLSFFIFITGLTKVFLPNINTMEERIRTRSNNIFITFSSVKWKVDSKISHYTCQVCEQEISVTDNICKNCDSEIKSCLICKLPIKSGQNMNTCHTCNYSFHSNHWDFWINSKGFCPNCKTNY